jgi:putative ABC transport system permease protein
MRAYLLVLLRNLARERLYAVINIGGLALGLASCLILGLFLKSELTYDRHFAGHENVYRMVYETRALGHNRSQANTSEGLGPIFAAEYPSLIRQYLRIRNNAPVGGLAMRTPDHPDKVYYWERSYFAEPNVFAFFPVKVIAGDPKTALLEENTLAISESVARRYFGNADPLGKLLLTEADTPRRITLVFADLPANTHLKFDLLHAMDMGTRRFGQSPLTIMAERADDKIWRNYTYVQMVPGFDPAEWGRMSQAVFRKYTGGRSASRTWLQPLRDVHLQDNLGYDLPTGNRAYLYGCAAVALIILAIACTNYMNLATARAARRARSVGFRKILGAGRLSLALQFLGEAMLFSIIALVLAAVITEVVLKFTPINAFMDGKAMLNLREDPQLALWLFGAAAAVGLVSGAYPAVYLSSWAPLAALTGRDAQGAGNPRLREVLVLVQFTISSAVIASTLLMMDQMHYVATRPLGFERDHRLLVMVRGTSVIERIPEIRNALLSNSHVRGVTMAERTPDKGVDDEGTGFDVETNEGASINRFFNTLSIGEDYERVMGLKITRGQALGGNEGHPVLVNEALVEDMGWIQPVGKRITLRGSVTPGKVVGVVEDFNFRSLKHLVEPVVIRRLNAHVPYVMPILASYQKRFLIVDVTGADMAKTLGFIGRIMTRADPRHPFSYEFLDEALNAQYKSELTLQKLIGIFAGISIFIAGMGLFGLTAFATEQRSREIGIRKVLGATAWQIVGMLSQRMLVLVLVASVLASGIAYFAIEAWLSEFAYRAEINPLVFVGSALAAALVAFATVAFQSWRTANADPVEALRRV